MLGSSLGGKVHTCSLETARPGRVGRGPGEEKNKGLHAGMSILRLLPPNQCYRLFRAVRGMSGVLRQTKDLLWLGSPWSLPCQFDAVKQD